MDLTPKPPEPVFHDPDVMRRQAENRSHREDIHVWMERRRRQHQLDRLKQIHVTADGVPVESINIFYEHEFGVVTIRDRTNLGFTFQGPLYADRKKALEAALSFWESRRTEATAKIRAICKELGLTG